VVRKAQSAHRTAVGVPAIVVRDLCVVAAVCPS
jgi:hypothetical protein